MSSLEHNGITATVEVAPNGELHVNLVTTNALYVTVNGKPVGSAVRENEDRARVQYWNPNGTQSTEKPMNLSGG